MYISRSEGFFNEGTSKHDMIFELRLERRKERKVQFSLRGLRPEKIRVRDGNYSSVLISRANVILLREPGARSIAPTSNDFARQKSTRLSRETRRRSIKLSLITEHAGNRK